MNNNDKCPKCGGVIERYGVLFNCTSPDCYYTKWSSVDDVDELRRQLAWLQSCNAELLALLREIEWRGATGWDFDPACSVCGNMPDQGHAPDCKIKAALEKQP